MREPGPARPVDLVLVGLVALALRLAMAWTIPLASGSPDVNCAPDERAHFLFTRALSEGRAPTWPDQTDSIYGAFLPTPYLAQAAALAVVGPADGLGRFAPAEGWARGYQSARIGSALVGALACLALALAAGAWTASRGAALATGLVAALYPQFVFLGAYTNADVFTLCAGALHAWAVARWARRGEGTEGLVAVGVTVGLVILGKMSGYFLLPVTGLWVLWAGARGRLTARTLGLAAAAAVALAGPFLAWNALRNGGDVLGLRRYHQFLAEVWHRHDGRLEPRAWPLFRWYLSRSSFGTFRNMDLYMPTRFFLVGRALLAIGLAAGAARLAWADGTTRRGALWLAGLVAANVALVAYNCWFVDFSPQGRYVLLSVLLLASVAVWSPTGWLGSTGWQGRLRWLWPVACLGFLAASAVQAQVLIYQHACLPRPGGGRAGAQFTNRRMATLLRRPTPMSTAITDDPP